MTPRLSLPNEHGGYLTVIGAAAAAAAVSAQPLPPLGIGLALLAAFVARGAIDRLAVGRRLRAWDAPALVALLAVGALGLVLAARGGALAAALAGGLAAGMAGLSPLLRRWHRDHGAAVELAAMSILGASGGLGAFAGGASSTTAAALAVVIGTQAAVAVPLVRTEIFRAGRAEMLRAAAIAAAGLAAAGAVLLALGRPVALLAFMPRLAQLAARLLRGPHPRRAAVVGLEETAALLATAAVAAFTLRY